MFPVMSSRKALQNCAGLLILTSAVLFGRTTQASTSLPLEPAESTFKFTGKSFLHTFQGQSRKISGSAEVNPSGKPLIQTATLVFKTAELTTFNKDRDGKMKDWLHVDTHPEIVFHLEKVTPVSGDYQTASEAAPAKFSVKGVLIINGVQQTIEGESVGWREKNHLVVSGQTIIDTLKFGLPQIRLAVITVATDVKAEYKFTFALPPELSLK